MEELIPFSSTAEVSVYGDRLTTNSNGLSFRLIVVQRTDPKTVSDIVVYYMPEDRYQEGEPINTEFGVIERFVAGTTNDAVFSTTVEINGIDGNKLNNGYILVAQYSYDRNGYSHQLDVDTGGWDYEPGQPEETESIETELNAYWDTKESVKFTLIIRNTGTKKQTITNPMLRFATVDSGSKPSGDSYPSYSAGTPPEITLSFGESQRWEGRITGLSYDREKDYYLKWIDEREKDWTKVELDDDLKFPIINSDIEGTWEDVQLLTWKFILRNIGEAPQVISNYNLELKVVVGAGESGNEAGDGVVGGTGSEVVPDNPVEQFYTYALGSPNNVTLNPGQSQTWTGEITDQTYSRKNRYYLRWKGSDEWFEVFRAAGFIPPTEDGQEPKVNPTYVTFNVKKSLTGDAPDAADRFKFVLEGDAEEEIFITGSGTASFTKLEFAERGQHQYNYTIREVKENAARCNYDPTVYKIVVTTDEIVNTKDEYNITQHILITTDEGYRSESTTTVNFTNHYDPRPAKPVEETSITINVKKEILGDTPKENEIFRYTVIGDAEEEVLTYGAGNCKFSPFKYTKAGNYTYIIQEKRGKNAFYKYDDTIFTVNVTVTEQDDGDSIKLVADVKIISTSEIDWVDTDTVVFRNTYSELKPVTVNLSIQKVIEKVGDVEVPEETYIFDMDGYAANQWSIQGAGTIELDPFVYTEPGKHNYTIKELPGENENCEYDTRVRHIAVTVVEKDLQLVATVVIDDNVNETLMVFTNVYKKNNEEEYPKDGDRLRVGKKRPMALMFNKPEDKPDYHINLAEWDINPAQEGVQLVGNKLVITKIKPNTWFIKSNYGFSSDAQRNEKFFGEIIKVSGIAALRADGTITSKLNNPWGDSGQSYYPTGLVVSLCGTDGGFLSTAYPWEMGIPGGAFKWGIEGWNYYGCVQDGDIDFYNSNVSTAGVPSWGGRYYEVGFGFFTGKEADADGYITLSTPITIEPENFASFNPTTVEGWKAYMKGILLYEKPRTFENVLMNYHLAFKETGNYQQAIQGFPPSIAEGTAYVVSERYFADEHDKISLPVPTDLEELIAKSFPMKFWVNQIDREGRPGFWDAVIKAFKKVPITLTNYASYLFPVSNIKGSYDKGGDGFVELNFDMPTHPDFKYDFINLAGIFDWNKSIDKVRFVVKHGYLTVIQNAFRQTMNALEAVEFVNESPEEMACAASQFSGAFEYCYLSEYPSGLGIYGRQTGYSEPACQISYAFHSAGFKTIGVLKQGGGRWTALTIPYCEAAFWNDSVTEILYDLDMKFVNPSEGAGNVFSCPNLVSARISGLNKGVWALAGIAHSGYTNGNLKSLDADSVNYLLNNIFDLRRNSSEQPVTNLTSCTTWAVTNGYSDFKHVEVYDNATSGTITVTGVPSGTLDIQIGSVTAFTLTIKNGSASHEIKSNGSHQIPITAGTITMTLEKEAGGVFTLFLNNPGKTEITAGLSSSTIYLPSALQSKASASALTEAKNRGWNVVFE